MATHQSLSGGTDDELLQRMIATHPDRFGEAFWAFFAERVTSYLPSRPVMTDLGCGPGLFLRDLGERYPAAALYGYDVTPAMIAYGQQLPSVGARPKVAVHDVASQPLPHAAGSVDLVSMSSVLHLLDEPLPVLAEIRRLLAPGGIFMLYDWIRQPLQTYLAWRRETLKEVEAEPPPRLSSVSGAQPSLQCPEHPCPLALSCDNLRTAKALATLRAVAACRCRT